MKNVFHLFLILFSVQVFAQKCYNAVFRAQLQAEKMESVRQNLVCVEKEVLENLCGTYTPSETDTHLGVMEIVLKDGNLYRRLRGDRDRLLLAVSADQFVYADGSGRTLEFIANEDKVQSVILSRSDGEFSLTRQ